MAAKPTFANIAAKAISSRPVAKPATPQIQIIAKPAGDSGPEIVAHNGATAKTPTDDTSTHVSSSESSVKLPNSFDKQSVASGTTFAMDEKESLRPDDSASLRAVNEDEDGPSTGPAGSRVGSDTDARAFSDQLHRIQQIGTRPQRQGPVIHFGTVQHQLPIPLNPTPEALREDVDEQPNPVAVAPGMPMVDVKLLEALESMRDRVFILKVEQDILDFMKNDKEAHLTLPDCNSFYRMLSHRLADYYGLDHTHHPRDSGTAVLISKLPTSRVPPPLAGIPVAGTQCASPPPPMAARKIMRRGEVGEGMSGPSTTANSEGPSKAASEIGDGASDGKKDKRDMTREEREKRYADARLRILGSAEPGPEDDKKTEDNDLSRSSSASGKKKSKKRKDDDDDFQPRSAMQFPYNYATQQQYAAGPYTAENAVYFPSQYGGYMTTPQQYASMATTASPPPATYAGGYGGDQAMSTQYMPFQQYMGQSVTTTASPNYAQQATSPYDLSTAFSGMNLGAHNQNSVQQKPASSPNFVPGQLPPTQQGWAPYASEQQYAYGMYGTQYQDRMSGQAQPQQAYMYGQLPNPAMSGNKMQHPIPGSFNRQQFNPQTQAFVPGGAGRGQPMQMPGTPQYYSHSPGQQQYGMSPNMGSSMQYRPSPPNGAQMPQHRPSPVKGNTGTYPSPAMQMQQPVQPYSNVTPTMHFQTPQPVHLQTHAHPHAHTHAHSPGQTHQLPQPVQAQPQSHARPLPLPLPQPQSQPPSRPLQISGLGASPSGPLAHPLPQPPNPESSIAKWGTPAHLPPKPPTPTNPHPTKFHEMNKGRVVVPGMIAGAGRGAFSAGASGSA